MAGAAEDWRRRRFDKGGAAVAGGPAGGCYEGETGHMCDGGDSPLPLVRQTVVLLLIFSPLVFFFRSDSYSSCRDFDRGDGRP
jgi:hypothetical protein